MKTGHYYTQNVRGFHGSRGVGARLRKLNERKLSTPRNRVPQKYHAPQSNFIFGARDAAKLFSHRGVRILIRRSHSNVPKNSRRDYSSSCFLTKTTGGETSNNLSKVRSSKLLLGNKGMQSLYHR